MPLPTSGDELLATLIDEDESYLRRDPPLVAICDQNMNALLAGQVFIRSEFMNKEDFFSARDAGEDVARISYYVERADTETVLRLLANSDRVNSFTTQGALLALAIQLSKKD